MGKRPINDYQVNMLALGLEYRGNDATGVALIDAEGHIQILKNDEPAWRFVRSFKYVEWIKKALTSSTRIALVHTRKATKGTFHKNENNHPMYAGKGGGVIIHNGMIYNDDALFDANKDREAFKRSGETDSDIIRALLDNHGRVDKDVVEEMCLMEGVAAVAAFHPSTPDKLLLLRDSNPLMLGATRDYLAFASDKQTLHDCLKPYVKRHNIVMQVHAPDLSFIPMPNESGWIIGPGGWEDHAHFKCNGRNHGGNIKYNLNTDYHKKHQTPIKVLTKISTPARPADDTLEEPQGLHEPLPGSNDHVTPPAGPRETSTRVLAGDGSIPKFVICPNGGCSIHVEIDNMHRKATSLAQLACESCGHNLVGALDATMIN